MKKYMTGVLVLVFILGSCGDQFLSSDYQDGDWFYLESKGAIMPVWVNGNKSSNIFILYLHGGPGQSAMGEKPMSGIPKLEQDYAVVYWDQRGSGISQGNVRPETLTIEQCVEDLWKLVHLIRYKYDNPSLFLMGNSWGGTLGMVYLLDPANQQYVSGWIDIDGEHNWENSIKLSAQWVQDRAMEKIMEGENAGRWQEELAWYANTTPSWDSGFVERHYENLYDLNGITYNFSLTINYLDYLNTPMTFSYPMNNNYIDKNFSLPTTLNLRPEMHKITVPTLILWGRHDGILPVEMAQTAFDSLGTNDNAKYKYIFENSAHTPHIEEQDAFVEKVRIFIKEYK
ncbi:MAG: alpha/beta hydrolase [Treponema sp.]|jgi:pimeloyl-ACP methyl ester carboxylesterase|nr:alpha/beta hydrolase [Treponema sp.]